MAQPARPPRGNDVSLCYAAFFSGAAGLVHAWAAGAHGDDSALARVFVVAALLQAGWAVAALVAPSRRLAVTGIAINGAMVVGWVLTHTVGVPYPEALQESQSIGTQDLVAAVLAALAVACAALGWRGVAIERPGEMVLVGLLALAGAVFGMTGEHGEHAHDEPAAQAVAFEDAGMLSARLPPSEGRALLALSARAPLGDGHATGDHAAGDDAAGGHAAGGHAARDDAAGGHAAGGHAEDGHAEEGQPAGGLGAAHGHGFEQPPPDQPLNAAEQAQIDQQWEQALETAERLATPTAAAAAGYAQASGVVPGVGAHWIKWSLVDREFDPAQPSMLLFDTITQGRPPQLVGLSYWVASASEPDGFAGPNDRWHRHFGLCFVDGWHREEGLAKRIDCEDTWVDGSDLWMLHAWPVEAVTNPWGRFASVNPRLCFSRPNTPDFLACDPAGV